MDKNCDNMVSLEELKHGFEVEAHVVLSMPTARQLFAAFDRNGDGTIDLARRDSAKHFSRKYYLCTAQPWTGFIYHRFSLPCIALRFHDRARCLAFS